MGAVAAAGLVAGCTSSGSPPPKIRSSDATSSAPATSVPSSAPPTAEAATHPTAPFVVERRIAVPGGVRRLVSVGRIVFALSEAGSTVTRLDSKSGRVGPRATVAGAVDMAYGDGLLWITQSPRARRPRRSARSRLVGLDPATLAVTRRLPLTERCVGVVFAGGFVWVAGPRHLFAVDPRRAVVRRTVAADNPEARHGAPIGVATSADGQALWTSEPVAGPVPVQLRDPRTGAVLASTSAAGNTVGGAGFAAAHDHAWLYYGTGMLGTYTRVDRVGSKLVERRDRTGEGVTTFTNGVSAHLVGGRLWVLDGQWAAVASDDTGQPLARSRFRTNEESALAGLPSGRLALSQHGSVVVVAPRRISERAYTDAIAALSTYLDDLPRLTRAHVLGYSPYRWRSPDHFVLMVTMVLHFRSHDGGAYGDGLNTRFVTFDRPTPTAPFRLSLATSP